MACACIDIGSNTTRLLVAECGGGGVRELAQQRVFTRLGRGLADGGAVPGETISGLAETVALMVRQARELGAAHVRAVATAALRRAGNRDEVMAAVRAVAGVEVELLSEHEEARLAFAGATRTLGHAPVGPVAVVDVGGGSSELVVGDLGSGVAWSASFRAGSGDLADAYLHSDPPAAAELESLRAHVDGVFEGVRPPAVRHGLAVGGSATSLRRLVGAVLEPETLERAIRVLATAPAADVARRFEIDPERIRLLPAGILILTAASELLGVPLQVARGGLREGVLLALTDVLTEEEAMA